MVQALGKQLRVWQEGLYLIWDDKGMSRLSHHIKRWSETEGFYFPVDTASTTPESLTSPIPAGPAKRGVKMTERFTTEIAPTFCSGAALKNNTSVPTGWREKIPYDLWLSLIWLRVTSSGKRRMLQALNVVSGCRFFMTKALILGSKHFPIYLNTFIPIVSKNYGIPLYIPLQHRANKIKKALVC